MNDNERLKLQEMITTNDVEDQTGKIRELKHSQKIRTDVLNILKIYSEKDIMDDGEYINKCIDVAPFLYNNYTDIFNKVRKNELHIGLLGKFLSVLAQIEDGDIDQHDGSFIVGKILKEMYVDSALRKSEHLDENVEEKKINEHKTINWNEYKRSMTL
jgi:hypothetical protein